MDVTCQGQLIYESWDERLGPYQRREMFAASSIGNLPNCTLRLLCGVSASARKAIGRPGPGWGALLGRCVDLGCLARAEGRENQERMYKQRLSFSLKLYPSHEIYNK